MAADSASSARRTNPPRTRPRPSVDRILAAAERVFARSSFGQTSLRQLVAASGMSSTAFYARFESKEAVLSALVERLITDLQNNAARKLSALTGPDDAVTKGVDALVSTLVDHRRVVAIALSEGAAVPPVREHLAAVYRGLVALIAGQLPGHNSDDRAALAWAFVGALQLQVTRWAVFEEIDTDALTSELFAVARTLLPAAVDRR